jgi:Ca-activated chloride channel family protein
MHPGTRRSVTALAAIAATFILPASSPAQGWIEPGRPVPGMGIVKLRSAVAVAVQGAVATVTVEEWFQNRGGGLGEGVYLYPLPGEAAFSSFSLWQGDTELRGETMDAGQARAIYEEIVRRRRDPALIELAGHGLIRARIFPIGPGETRKITLRYTQLLARTGDAWRFHYAMGTGPGVAGASRTVRLTAEDAGRYGQPYSPTHRLQSRRSDGRLEVTVADSAPGDLDILLPLVRDRVGLSLLTHRPVGEDGYFMMLLAPGAARDVAPPPRDLVAVLDVSGSMSGEKLTQARAALEALLGTLRAGDRFRLIAFESGIRRFETDWTTVSMQSRRRAVAWLATLQSGGGTNIAGALSEAFRLPATDAALGVVVFLTDGLPTVGEQDPERIAIQAEQERGTFRVFAFGIGYDVNTYLLDRLTEGARGTTAYVPPGGDIETAVGELARKITSPVLTDIAIAASPGVELYDLQPGTAPDLFAGDQLVVFGRYRNPTSGSWTVSVHGRRGARTERFQTEVSKADVAAAADYIPRLWAARKAGVLSREIRLHGQTPEILAALKDLALRYGVLTEYTSYLVQEPSLAANGLERMDGRILPAAAPVAPRDQVGAGAVARSRKESRQATASVVVEDGDLADVPSAGKAASIRRVGGRLFVLRAGIWTDLRHGDSLRVVTVAPFSPAYFALLQSCPELSRPAALAPVIVAGRRISIEIAEGGRETLGPGEADRLATAFRE